MGTPVRVECCCTLMKGVGDGVDIVRRSGQAVVDVANHARDGALISQRKDRPAEANYS